MLVVIMMMSMSGFLSLVSLGLAVVGYNQGWFDSIFSKDDEDILDTPQSGDESMSKDPETDPDANCVVIMNNTPDDNPNGKTQRFCLNDDTASRSIDFKQQYTEFHDEISAARVGKGLRVEFFEHEQYGGQVKEIDGSKTNFVDFTQHTFEHGDDWNDDISSMKIHRL